MKRILLFLIAIFFTTGAGSTGIGANDSTASCDNNTLGQTSGTANMEIDWQPNTINIGWYDGNTRLTVQNTATTCSYGSDLYLPNTQPTKTGYTFKGWEIMNVPSGYTRLQYIESTGEQIIYTGIYANENTAIETRFINTADPSDSRTRIIIANAWGAIPSQLDGSVYNGTIFQLSITPQTRAFSCIGSVYNIHGDYWKIGEDYTVYMDQNSGEIINNTVYRWEGIPNSFTTSNQLTMFGVTDVSFRGAIAILYYLKILQNDTLVRNYIPARRNSDNVVGMWDTVSQTFFTNAGSGSFIAGPVAQ